MFISNPSYPKALHKICQNSAVIFLHILKILLNHWNYFKTTPLCPLLFLQISHICFEHKFSMESFIKQDAAYIYEERKHGSDIPSLEGRNSFIPSKERKSVSVHITIITLIWSLPREVKDEGEPRGCSVPFCGVSPLHL